jgi:hypothetical protein
MAAGSAEELLRAVLAGARPERPLIAPLASAAAGELQALAPRAILDDVTKLANLVRDLTLSLRADVAVAEFGTYWDAEAAGVRLDWSGGMPRPAGGSPAAPGGDFASAGRAPTVHEAIRRLKTMLAGRALVAAGVTGPATLGRLLGHADTAQTVELTMAAVRGICDAGANVVWVVEQPQAPEDPAGFASAMAPVWGTIRFYQALGVLHVAGAADAWAPVLEVGGPYLACVDPDAAPALADAALANGTPFGLALGPGPAGRRARELAATGSCALLTNDGELAGRVPGRELSASAQHLRAAAKAA